MAMFSFFQAIGGILVFFYTNHLHFGLRLHIYIMAVGSLLTLAVFCIIVNIGEDTSTERDDEKAVKNLKVTEASVLTEKNGIEMENGTANGHGIERTANKETDVSVV